MKIIIFVLISLFLISGCVQESVSDGNSNPLPKESDQKPSGKVAADDFGTMNTSSDLIAQAEVKVALAEEKINKLKVMDVSGFSEEDKGFFETTLDKIEELFENSKQKLDNAKELFENQDYSNASSFASSALNNAQLAVTNSDKLLKGKNSTNWNRVDSITTSSFCGDDICDAEETYSNCPSDCDETNDVEVHLNVAHNLQEQQSACAYYAAYNTLEYYQDELSLEDFLGISGYYSSFAEMHYGFGFEKYHGKFNMIGGKVLPELGYITYEAQKIKLEEYEDKEAPIIESLNNGIPLYFIPIHENYWYLIEVSQRDDPTIIDFDEIDVFSKPSVAHAVIITGYKIVQDKLFLEISDSSYEDGLYYYLDFANYLEFHDYIRNNQELRDSFEDPLIENTWIVKIVEDPNNKFKLEEPDKSLHTIYKIIDSLYISAILLDGKIYDENTRKKGYRLGCDFINLVPKVADTLDLAAIESDRLNQAKSELRSIPQILGSCEEIKQIDDNQVLTERIANATNKLFEITDILSEVVQENQTELSIQKDGKRITLLINPKIENVAVTKISLDKRSLQTDIQISNIEISSGTINHYADSTMDILEATYPLTVSFDAESSEERNLLLMVDIEPFLKGEEFYNELGYTEILVQTVNLN